MKTRPHALLPALMAGLLLDAIAALPGLAAPQGAPAFTDRCSKAPLIAVGHHRGSLQGATAGQPDCFGYGQPDVWCKFLAPADGTLRVQTCTTHRNWGTDTTLGLFADCTAAGSLGCDDDVACSVHCPDGSCAYDALTTLRMVSGEEVRIRISRYYDPVSDPNPPGTEFELEIEFSESVRTYCSGKVHSLGCVPFITTVGSPSASAPTPFRIGANQVLPGSGTLLYGFTRGSLAFHGGTLCIKPPFARTPLRPTRDLFGTVACETATIFLDFNRRIRNGVDPTLTAGQRVFAQWRLRDPQDPAGFGDSLSNGLAFTIEP